LTIYEYTPTENVMSASTGTMGYVSAPIKIPAPDLVIGCGAVPREELIKMDNRVATGWGEAPEPDLNIPFWMTREYQIAEAAAKAAKARAIKRNAKHRQDRARVDGVTLLWGLSLIALGLVVLL